MIYTRLLVNLFIVQIFVGYNNNCSAMRIVTNLLDPSVNIGTLSVKYVQEDYTMSEAISLENRNLTKTPTSSHDEQNVDFGVERIMCKGGSDSQVNIKSTQLMKIRIKHSIQSTLGYYSSHLDALNRTDYAIGLANLKAVDDKLGGIFQSNYPVEEWILKICENAGQMQGKRNCLRFMRSIQTRDERNSWSDPNILLQNMNAFVNVGTGMETLSPRRNYECIDGLLSRCEVTQVCHGTFFNAVPQSRYMLTHQLLHRILVKTHRESCGLSDTLFDEEINQKLCGKMLQESQFIAGYGAPFIFRDLFAEQVAICGFSGYPNFFRDDWLNMILSWQSKSDHGCFLKEQGSKFISRDVDIPRRITEKELKMGQTSTNEICQPHFTSVSLSALVMAWDYLEDNCGK